MGVSELIRTNIKSYEPGELFTSAELMRFGKRASVDQALVRLVRAGELERIIQGIYMRPWRHEVYGMLGPDLFEIAQAKAEGPVDIGGAEAARLLGFPVALPNVPVFLTTGPSRRFKLGGMVIELKQVAPRKLVAPGTRFQLALSALWFLGKEAMGKETFARIQSELSPEDYEALKGCVPLMPYWMSDGLYNYERSLARDGEMSLSR